MPTTNYFITTNELPNLLQLQYVSLDYDTTINDAAVYLPELSTIEASLIEIQIANIGPGTVTIIPFTQVGPPAIQNRISGATSFAFTGTGKFYTLRINQVDGVNTEWAIEQPLSISVAAANRATLATPTYINYPIGFQVYVLNYNATAKGCSIEKKSIAAGTFADWIVTGTEATISTGGFGAVPAA
jgi:hypothetical protein